MCYFFYSLWFFVWFFQPGISPTSSSSSTWLVWKGWKSWVVRAAPSRSWPPPQSTSRCQTWKARTTSSKYSTSPTKSFQKSLTSRSKQVGRSLKNYIWNNSDSTPFNSLRHLKGQTDFFWRFSATISDSELAKTWVSVKKKFWGFRKISGILKKCMIIFKISLV